MTSTPDTPEIFTGPDDGNVPTDTYTHGHQASVLRSHTWRTVDPGVSAGARYAAEFSTVRQVWLRSTDA